MDDVEDFNVLNQALTHLGLSNNQIMEIYSTVAAVLHLGNIEFEDNPEDSKGGCRVAQSSERSLIMSAKLLGIDSNELCQALISRVMQSARGGIKGTVIM